MVLEINVTRNINVVEARIPSTQHEPIWRHLVWCQSYLAIREWHEPHQPDAPRKGLSDTPQQEVVLRSQEDVLAYRATLVGNHLYGIKELWHALRLVDDHPGHS